MDCVVGSWFGTICRAVRDSRGWCDAKGRRTCKWRQECRPIPWTRANPDSATVALDDAPDDAQSKTVSMKSRTVNPLKGFEGGRGPGRIEADLVVADEQHRAIGRSAQAFVRRARRPFSGRRRRPSQPPPERCGPPVEPGPRCRRAIAQVVGDVAVEAFESRNNLAKVVSALQASLGHTNAQRVDVDMTSRVAREPRPRPASKSNSNHTSKYQRCSTVCVASMYNSRGLLRGRASLATS